MIELRVKDVDTVLVKQLFESLNVKAITSSGRIIFSEYELEKEDFLKRLCSYATVIGIQNYCDDLKYQNFILNAQVIESYDLVYPEVKRGQVYWCDFGIPYKCEVAFQRPAIVIQNDAINAQTVLVIPCTTSYSSARSWRFKFKLEKQNMVDFYLSNDKESYLMTDAITHIDKSKLRSYIGTMTEQFMSSVDESISKTLALKKRIIYKTSPQIVYLKKEAKPKLVQEKIRSVGNVNIKQIQMLANVDIDELIKVSKSHASNEVKAEKILEIFGFDMDKKGTKYLLKAIISSIGKDDYNLETLSYKISKEETGISKEEIKRLVVARVKEQLKFKNSPCIDFIRLVDTIITQGGFAE